MSRAPADTGNRGSGARAAGTAPRLQIGLLDPQISIFELVDFRLQRQQALRGDFQRRLENLAITGTAGFCSGHDHFDRIPVAVPEILQRLVRADAQVVADLELVLEHLVPQVQPAVGFPGGAEFEAEREVAVKRFAPFRSRSPWAAWPSSP